jgi:hypothetical protein
LLLTGHDAIVGELQRRVIAGRTEQRRALLGDRRYATGVPVAGHDGGLRLAEVSAA